MSKQKSNSQGSDDINKSLDYNVNTFLEYKKTGLRSNAVAINNRLQFVEIGSYSSVGQFDALYYGSGVLGIHEVQWVNKDKALAFGTLGVQPCITMNDDGVVLAFYVGGGIPSRININYSFGICSLDGTVDWQGFQATPSYINDSRFQPSFDASINNNNVTVLSYRLNYSWTPYVYAALGVADATKKTINWKNDGKLVFDPKLKASHPSISINNRGNVICVAVKYDTQHVIYRIGTADEKMKEVKWLGVDSIPKLAKANKKLTRLSVSLSDDDYFVLAYNDVMGMPKCYVGQLNTDKAEFKEVNPVLNSFMNKAPTVSCSLTHSLLTFSNNSEMQVEGPGSLGLSTFIDYSNWFGNFLNLIVRNGQIFSQSNASELTQLIPSLSDIVLPGSHDAAVSSSTVHGHTNSYVLNSYVVTQALTIKEQLSKGVRFFEIRPALSKEGEFYSAHLDWKVGTIYNSYVGASGEKLSDLLGVIANFVRARRELVVLTFSHYADLSTDDGQLSAENFKRLIELIDDRLTGVILTRPTKNFQRNGRKVSTTPLIPTFFSINSQKGCVIPFLTGISDETVLRRHAKVESEDESKDKQVVPINGIFKAHLVNKEKLPPIVSGVSNDTGNQSDSTNTAMTEQDQIFNSYANSEKVGDMRKDQFDKFKDYVGDERVDLYNFSWTLTQQGLTSHSILSLAKTANQQLVPAVEQAVREGAFTKNTKPNIILTDASDTSSTKVSIWLNYATFFEAYIAGVQKRGEETLGKDKNQSDEVKNDL